MDFFWFIIMCFFIFYLPFKLWIVKDENAQLEDSLQFSKQQRSISDGSSELLAKELVEVKSRMYNCESVVSSLLEDLAKICEIHERMGRVCKVCKTKYPCDTMKVADGY